MLFVSHAVMFPDRKNANISRLQEQTVLRNVL